MNKKNQKSPTVSRERFDNAVADIYRERAKVTQLQSTTVPRERFDRAIADIRKLRAQLSEAYSAGASAVLNSEVFNDYVPTSTRRNLRPSRFGAQARRRARSSSTPRS